MNLALESLACYRPLFLGEQWGFTGNVTQFPLNQGYFSCSSISGTLRVRNPFPTPSPLLILTLTAPLINPPPTHLHRLTPLPKHAFPLLLPYFRCKFCPPSSVDSLQFIVGFPDADCETGRDGGT